MTRRIFLVCDHFLYSHGDVRGGGSQRFCYIITMITTTLPLYSVGDD